MYGIIAEDNSDIECLKVLIKRLAKNDSLKIKHKGYKGCANMLRDGWKELKAYSQLSHITHFIVCYDKDDSKGQTRYEEVINKIIKPSGIKKDKNKICILIPTQEIEAWILADIQAVTQIISSWQPSENFASPETIESPKEKLIKLSQVKNAKPLYDHATHNSKIFEKINLQTVKNKCPSFVELAQFIENDIANYPKN
jgi:hypothetical protein